MKLMFKKYRTTNELPYELHHMPVMIAYPHKTVSRVATSWKCPGFFCCLGKTLNLFINPVRYLESFPRVSLGLNG